MILMTKEQAIALLQKPLSEMSVAERKLLPIAIKLVSQLTTPTS